MNAIAIAVLFTLIFWGMFYYSFSRDRSRYRNCYLLCMALLVSCTFAEGLQDCHRVKLTWQDGEKNKAQVDEYGREAFEKTISDAIALLK